MFLRCKVIRKKGKTLCYYCCVDQVDCAYTYQVLTLNIYFLFLQEQIKGIIISWLCLSDYQLTFNRCDLVPVLTTIQVQPTHIQSLRFWCQ
jgi:hypothetical protein